MMDNKRPFCVEFESCDMMRPIMYMYIDPFSFGNSLLLYTNGPFSRRVFSQSSFSLADLSNYFD